eukprot:6739713-Lingulodinium_polyedra.AAC.1
MSPEPSRHAKARQRLKCYRGHPLFVLRASHLQFHLLRCSAAIAIDESRGFLVVERRRVPRSSQ